MVSEVGILTSAYLFGAIPTSYLVAHYLSGTDMRRFGSGNVGASNLATLLGTRIGLSVGIFDSLVKGWLPIALASTLNLNLGTQALIGIAVIVGHNWSPYLKFTGGRGVATVSGIIIAQALWWEVIVELSIIGIVGKLVFKDTALWTFIGILILPLMNIVLGRPQEIVYMTIGMVFVLVLKRLTANWEKPVNSISISKAIGCRLLFDRDIPNQDLWKNRRLPE